LKLIGSFGKPAILSTGMSTLGEIETALEAIGEENRGQIILMHCTSDYPARWDEANLRAIQTLREAFHLPVGFSDHTEGIELPLVAVGLGAVVIEKHITLSKAMDGGDHKASLEPGEFKDMVVKIRSLEKALGDGIKRCMPSEENVRDVARKSLVTARPLKKGDQLTPEDIAIKRPGTGISPLFLEKIRGARLMADLPEGRVLQWSQLQLADKEYN
jgi:sialic acid synthase SpsE